MAKHNPLMWQPTEIVEVTNVGSDNLILELLSGPLRLDIGLTVRITASALQQPQVKALLDGGAIKAVPLAKRK